jgi:lysyl endopeptidase
MMLTDSNQRYCSGVLINNGKQDGTQYFLTAKHCVRDDVSYYIVGFNYEKQRCESNGALKSALSPKEFNEETSSEAYISLTPQSMLQPQTVQGFELLAEWDVTDYALLRIKERIPDHYNVYLAGWDISDTQPRGGYFCVHHPMGDFKKISTFSGQIQKASWIDDPDNHVHWQIIAWGRGTTERGSSGSPLYNIQGKVIGHLRGGFSSCETILGSDYYGGLAWDWLGDRGQGLMKRFLDPGNGGLKTLPGNYFIYIRN